MAGDGPPPTVSHIPLLTVPPGDQTPLGILLDISQRLGIVEGQQLMIMQEQGRAADGRGRTYARIEETQATLGEVKRDVKGLSMRVEVLEPDVRDFVRLRLSARVIMVVAGVFMTAVLAVLALAFKEAWTWFWAHFQWR